MKRTHYNQDLKLKIVQKYLKGISSKQLCAEYKIPKSTLIYWISKYRNICHLKGKIIILQQTLFAYCKMQLSSICRQLKILTRNELFTNCNQLKSMDCNNAL